MDFEPFEHAHGQGVFFLLWPLFARAPRHWFLEDFLLSVPGVQSVFFVATFREQKKTPWVVFFFCCCPARTLTHSLRAWVVMPPPRRGGVVCFAAAPPGPGWCFFFAVAPPGRSLTHCGLGRFRHGPCGVCFFFAAAPPGLDNNNKKCLGCYGQGGVCVFFLFCSGPVPAPNAASPSRGRSKKNTMGGVFFLLWPRAGAQRGFSFPCLSPGPQQKKNTLGGVVFLLWPRAGTGLLLPLPFPGAGAKKKPGWCFFFFAAAPRGRSLTHCGPGWRCLPLAGVVLFFLLRPRPDRGGVFFLLWPRPDAHSLTVGWGDFGTARVVFFFFAAAPPGLFRQ